MPLVVFLGVLGLILINIFLTYEAINWIPFSVRKRTLICVLIWLFPLAGSLIAYKLLKLNLFKRTSYTGGTGGSGLLEADAIFNPQARHYIEFKQEKAHVVAVDCTKDEDKEGANSLAPQQRLN